MLPECCLGGGSEDRLGQQGAVLQAWGQPDIADRALGLVLKQAGASEVPACHALNRQHVEISADHRSTLHCLRHLPRRDMVGHDVLELAKPPQGECSEDASLVGDQRRQNPVECRDAVTCHEQQTTLGSAIE